MRTTQVIASLTLALAAATATSTAAAAPTCRWAETLGWPVLSERGGVVYFRHGFLCPGEAAGDYQVTFFAGRGAGRRQVDQEKGEVKPRGRWQRHTKLDDRLAPSQYCDGAKPGTIIMGRAPNGVDDRAMFELPIEAKVTASGDLAGLASSYTTTALCGACDGYASYRNSMMIKTGRAGASRIEPGVRMVAEVDPPWYACAKQGATVEVRYFAGDDRDAVMRAMRPDVVQSGLERQFEASGKKVTLDVPVPVAALCKTGKKQIAWEAMGRGELKRISGGGRSLLALACKKR